MAVGYGIFASLICWIMALASHTGCRRVDSPLLRVDAVNWIINAAISTCVLGAFVGIFLIQGTSLEGFVPYVDPSLVLIVIAISISAPVRMAWQALMELLNRTPSADVLREVRNEVEAGVADLPVQSLAVRVVQPGRTRMVWVHIVLPPSWSLDGLGPLDVIRTRLHDRLKRIYDTTALDVVFTADPQWGGVDVAGTAAVGPTAHEAVAQNAVAETSVDDPSVT